MSKFEDLKIGDLVLLKFNGNKGCDTFYNSKNSEVFYAGRLVIDVKNSFFQTSCGLYDKETGFMVDDKGVLLENAKDRNFCVEYSKDLHKIYKTHLSKKKLFDEILNELNSLQSDITGISLENLEEALKLIKNEG